MQGLTLYLPPHFPASWVFMHKALIAMDLQQPSQALKEAAAWNRTGCGGQMSPVIRTQSKRQDWRDTATGTPSPGPGQVQNGPCSPGHHSLPSLFSSTLGNAFLLLTYPTNKGHAEHSLQPGQARSRGLKPVSMPWCCPRGTYLFFMTFKLIHPEVLHLPRYCLGSGARVLVYPLESCGALQISVLLVGTLLVVSGALVNNATGNRRCDHLQGV